MSVVGYVNGRKSERPITQEEVAAQRAQMLRERSRPLTEGEVLAMLIPGVINTAQVDDNTALRMMGYYPQWQSGADYTVGYKVQFDGKLWRCRQAHSAIVGWEPENAASLWEQICETHDGTEDDPIPYEGNMALEKDKYYMQGYEVYLCIRDTVNPVYNPLKDLVGLYVEQL